MPANASSALVDRRRLWPAAASASDAWWLMVQIMPARLRQVASERTTGQIPRAGRYD